MHLLIPYAAPPAELPHGAAPVLPQLQALLARCVEVERDSADPTTLSPPHERALARALGWRGGDGRWPWAARAARADGIEVGTRAWGLLTPAHWQLGTDQVRMLDPAALRLDDAASRALLDAVGALFVEAGYALAYGAPLRWYAAHAGLATLATASLDRVVGRNVDAWLGADPALRDLRRLQSEVQMLLHAHALNARREAAGLLPVNSFWLSGCGVAQPLEGSEPLLDERLRAPALAGDVPAWLRAWEALDEGPVARLLAAAQRGQAVRLTLCGERAWAAFAPAARALVRRLRSLWSAPAPLPLLEGL